MGVYKSKQIKDEIKLFPHQEDATRQALINGGSVILAHDTGTGKTLSFINTFEKLREEQKADKALVVLPAALRDNFVKNGIEKFTKNSSYTILGNKQEIASGRLKNLVDIDKNDKFANYNIVSYDLFKKDPEKYLDKIKPDTVIYDEIHRAKNEDTKITKVLKEQRSKYKNFIAGTGSVISNSPADVVPLIDIMTNGQHKLGTKALFERRFLKEDAKGVKKVVNRLAAKNQLKRYIHYVGKEDLKNYAPPKVEEHTEIVEMSPYQDEVYRYIYDKLDPATKLKIKMGVGKISNKELKSIFNKLMAARQAANTPYALDFSNLPDIEEGYENSPKIKKLVEDVIHHLETTSDGKVIVGSQFITGGIDILEHGLRKKNIPYAKFIGKGNKGVNESTRQQAVRDFKSGKAKVLLISSAGGEGLDFPDTTMIAMLDGHFNPEVVSQMKARGIRAGGQQHRDPKDRKVIVKNYHSIPRISKTEVISNLSKSVSPSTYINRFLNNEKILQNPFARLVSVDQLIDEVAQRKELANKDVKNLLKTAYFKGRYIDFSKHLRDYNNKYGDKIISLGFNTDDNDFVYFNKEDELKRVHALRKDINKALANSQKAFGYSRITAKEKDKKFNEKGIEKTPYYIKTKILPLTVAFGMLGVQSSLGRAARMEPRSAGGKFILGAASASAALGGLLGIFSSKNQLDGDFTKVKLKRLKKLSDENLLKILRGDVVTQTTVKKEDFYL